jgi:ribosomal-protein-serine acetyltransferase
MGRIALSERFHLRLLEEPDAGVLHRLIEANRDHLARWLPWAAGQTAADTLEFVRRARAQLAANDGFQLAVVRDEEIVGVVGYHGVDWTNRTTSIGYWLAEDAQGSGTMTQAVGWLTEHALSGWGLGRVEIRAAVRNRRSRAIPERLGFAEEAVLRAAERVGGVNLDLAVYSVTTD